jgi:hypothetical protein
MLWTLVMLKRLLVSLFEGSITGGATAFVLSRVGEGNPAALLVYAAAALTGALTGLVAGKPIWARAAKLEGLLKSVAGAFMAVTVLFGMRKWLPGVTVDLGRFGAASGPIGSVAWVALPLIAIAISLVLEVDDAFGPETTPPPRKRVEGELRAPSAEALDEAEASETSDALRQNRK